MKLFHCLFIAVITLLPLLSHADAQESSLQNPTKRQYASELVRLLTPAPADSFIVKEDGIEVPHQVEEIEGKNWRWVCSNFAPGASHSYQVLPGKPKVVPPLATIRKEGGLYVLENGIVAVKIPASPENGLLGPVSGIRMNGKWVGGSSWHTVLPLKKFIATVVGDGTLFAKIRLRYDFNAMAGINTDIQAFAEIDVTLGPGWSHVELSERHEMTRDDYWEFEASKGWSPDQGLSQSFTDAGPGSGSLPGGSVPSNRPLKPGGLPNQRDDLFINLLPRWNQHYKDGWYFAATDGAGYVGAVVVRASQWVWPHDNSIEVLVKATGNYASLRGSTWHGRRLWWLFAPAMTPANIDYVTRYAWEGLDKLNHEFILDWPGHAGAFSGMNFYDGNEMNPTASLRGVGRQAIANAGKPGDISTLTRVQTMEHPDAYGSYWNYWSPENCNFFTDFMKIPIALTAGLVDHPRFEELRKRAEAILMEDLYHSVTLPGGAGQECPGYQAYALKNWTLIAAVAKKYLGFDPTTWERFKAAQSFLNRITQPDGAQRRMLPMGDTHPSADGPTVVNVPVEEVRKFTTQELPGFGVIFNNNAGTPQETYLAFKSGPNRGHYHGDQLAIHFCADAKAIVVNHHSSYHPRAGQEHMHNRVAFHTDDLPYANMDGYERLIAFKTSPAVDIAMGQVESDRLRKAEKLPPEIWDQRYPQHVFAKSLIYRRTMVFVKGTPHDYFVIRDQYWAPEPVYATYCLHVLSEKMDQKGSSVDFGNLTLYCAQPEKFDFESFPWSHDNGGHEATQGARLTMKSDKGEFITVLYPGKAPEISTIPGGVKVGADEVTFAGDQPASGEAATVVSVKRNGNEVLTLTGNEIDMNRSQGNIGLFIPDAGYPFGDIPDWLIKQRATPPDWAKSDGVARIPIP